MKSPGRGAASHADDVALQDARRQLPGRRRDRGDAQGRRFAGALTMGTDARDLVETPVRRIRRDLGTVRAASAFARSDRDA